MTNGLTRRYATLRITHITVVDEVSAVVVDAHPDQGSASGRWWRHLGASLPLALAVVTVSLVSVRGS